MSLTSIASKHRGFLFVFCFGLLITSCRSTDIEDEDAATSNTAIEENAMPQDETGSTGDELPEAEESPTADGAGEIGVGPITIESGVILPEYETLDLPYSQWGAQRSQELLRANGFGDTVDEWRRAAGHTSGLVRGAAVYLLVKQLDPADDALFRKGLKDIDETVQSLSAYGLVRLGDDSAGSTLQRLAHEDPDAFLAAPLAASLLAELGDASAYDTMIEAMSNQYGYVRLSAVQYVPSFVPFHGRSTPSGQLVDVWSLYCQALEDEDGQVRAVAMMQLEELDSAEAAAVLEDCSNQ